MHYLVEIFSNRILWAAVASWFIAQFSKVLVYWAIEKHFDIRRFFGAGGMPSSHTSAVVALAVMVGGVEGYHTTSFAIVFVFMCIVMYDAAGVRRETGTQAKVINRILKSVIIEGKPVTDKELKELVGHTPLEVFAGFIIGLIIGLLFLGL